MDKRRSHAPIIAAVLLLLSVLYVGSYVALIVPSGVVIYSDGPSAPLGGWTTDRHYRWGGRCGEFVFWPLEQIDRRLRPEAWEYSDQLRRKLERWQRQNPAT